ncbi:L,D-transpeptidase [Conexibacter sp. CPCC 206217]|uniref:L,D-transpeptidase n=1 Tax=Conexibacter sp. CPCC 206217 TaxID=3064574 RepID=UPI00271C674C|nr:L,D-transpeptidase [Conexibacter sp. CPCC 206217]MDO8211244.1 L,D-transpeptidase [Conexibacter sp. CPCC 206217]
MGDRQPRAIPQSARGRSPTISICHRSLVLMSVPRAISLVLIAAVLAGASLVPAAVAAPAAKAAPSASAPAKRPPADRPSALHAPTARGAWTATVVETVVARVQPGERAKAVRTLDTRAPFWGGPNVLLVLGSRMVADERWLDVLVKGMPAGSHGWIPARAAQLARTDRRIVVDLSERTLTFSRAGRRVLSTSVVVGAPETPTPLGQFAVDAIAKEPPGSLLGPRVLALVAYSRALARYQGGIPQAAIHAADQLGDPLGTAASHGCVRAPQTVVNRLLTLAPRGTPVLIQR